MKWKSKFVLVLTIAFFTTGAFAQDAFPADSSEGKPALAVNESDSSAEAAADLAAIPDFSGADIAWMLTCSALVLMMTAPGLALFYGGLVRKKNILSVMMQCVFLMGMMTVLWAVIGYSLAFGGTNPYIGDCSHVCLKGVRPILASQRIDELKADLASAEGKSRIPIELEIDKLEARIAVAEKKSTVAVYTPGEGNPMPQAVFMVFQGMFFIITPALICGAFAERMKFSTMCVFMVLWGLLIYCPIAHWVWSDSGWLCEWNEAALFPALDFAGGTVVHISSGVSALVCALFVGRRMGFGAKPMPPHNLTYTCIGTALLWVGWFGFNAGSALAPNAMAVNAFVATHLAAAGGVIAWALAEWILRGKPTVLGGCSGAVAGLVCVTPACGAVSAMSAVILGLIAGVVCFWSCTGLKKMFGYDDSLDAFGVHGVGGTVGALLTGVFATKVITGGRSGLLEESGEGFQQVLNQLVSIGAAAGLAAVGTAILLAILNVTMGLRVTPEQEEKGLDIVQHGEEGYIFL